jgi:phosphate-selective porin OprO/OprP
MKKLKSNKLNRLAAVAAVIGTQFYSAGAHGAALSDDEIKALVQRVNELEQQVKSLQHERKSDKETADDKAKTTPTVSFGASGLIVRSADSNFVMNAHGYVQADDRTYFGQKTTPDTLLLRRVRPIVEGSVWKDFNYRLMLDFGQGTANGSNVNNQNLLDDAYVNAHFWQQAQIQAGKYKSPMGLERLQSTADLLFVETGFATELTPNYDTGVMVHNDYFNTPIGYAVGIFDGAADGGSEDFDADQGKDAVARLFFQPFLNTDHAPIKNLGFGVAGSTGTHTGGTFASYKTSGQQTIFAYNTANVTGFSGNQYRLDPQAYYFWGPFGIMGEYVLSSQRFSNKAGSGLPPVTRFNNDAWQVEATYFITGEQNSFKASSTKHVVPLHRFSLGQDSGWGAFEVVGRVQQITFDNNAFQKYGANTFALNSVHQATAWGVGVNWYFNENVKLNLDYESTSLTGGNATAHTPEHVILSRVQVAF